MIFEVADHGAGLTAEQEEHAFERFYRTDRARTRKAGGTGLGLAIVAALTIAHGGAVWVESPPGGGADFGWRCRSLPRRGTASRSPASSRQPRPGRRAEASS